MRFKAIVFDRDGVIFDTFNSPELAYHKVKEFLSDNGVTCPSIKDFFSILEKSKRKFLIKVSDGRLKKKDFVEWCKKHEYEIPDMSLIYVRVFPWVKETLEKLYSMGFQMALTSGWLGTRATKEVLRKHGINEYFKVVLTLDEYIIREFDERMPVRRSRAPFRRSVKKKAWLITESLNTLGVKPSDAIFVGDSPEDMLAGKKLGTRTVAVLTGWGERYKQRFEEIKPDQIIDSIANLPEVVSCL